MMHPGSVQIQGHDIGDAGTSNNMSCHFRQTQIEDNRIVVYYTAYKSNTIDRYLTKDPL